MLERGGGHGGGGHGGFGGGGHGGFGGGGHGGFGGGGHGGFGGAGASFGGGHAGFGGGAGGHWGPGPGGGGPAGPGPGGHTMAPVIHTGGSSGPGHFAARQTNVHAFHGGRRFFRGRGGIFSGAWPIVYGGGYWPLYYPVETVTPTGPIEINLGPKGVLYVWAEGDIVYWSLNGSPWQATNRLNFNLVTAALGA